MAKKVGKQYALPSKSSVCLPEATNNTVLHSAVESGRHLLLIINSQPTDDKRRRRSKTDLYNVSIASSSSSTMRKI